jgi:hypothetical protein
MTTNVSTTDRAVRLGLAVLAVVAAYLAGFGSVLGIVLLVVAAVLAVTAVVRFCPLYRLFGMSTSPR